MASKPRQCKCCGKKYPADKPDGMVRGLNFFADMNHLMRHVRAQESIKHFRATKKADKEKKKVHAKQKRDFYDKDLPTRKKAAKAACHKYIRERDKGNSCICCDLPLGAKYDAGHWLESGNYPFTRYHEDNIHAQSVHCNQYKGGDSGGYERNLRVKIGNERVDWLLDNKNTKTDKRTADDYKAIEQHFKAKLKELSS